VLVKDVVYILCLFIFAVSIFNLIYSIKNKNKNSSKYIILLSIIFILYSITDVFILPNILDLDVGFELLLFYGILIIAGILFIISIIVASRKAKKLNTIDETIKYKIVFTLLVLLPIFMFCFSYFREMYYINNSKLILICSRGDEFSEEDYGYAISNDYSKTISVGAGFRGYAMKKHLPSSFYKLDYTWVTDKIEINHDNITIFRNNKKIYKIDITNKISYCDVEEVFYKQ
jgi:hypothetical protein